MRIVVTGAAGFVGTAVARGLVADGHEVVALVREPVRAAGLAGVQLRSAGLGDPNELVRALSGSEAVVHAAAVTSHRAHPDALAWVNVAGTENLLAAARHVGVRRVVHISCADVTLHDADRVHWSEGRHPTVRLLDAHARSKALGEALALAASQQGLEVCALRPAWIWGPGDSRTMPALCLRGARGPLGLIGDGSALVGTLYIDHLVASVRRALEADSVWGRAYYLADPAVCDAKEFIGGLCAAAGLPTPRPGLPFPVAMARARLEAWRGGEGAWPSDVVRLGRSSSFDVHAAVRDLDFDPKVDFELGIARLADWVTSVGGAEALRRAHRGPATRDEVAAQIDLAHAEER